MEFDTAIDFSRLARGDSKEVLRFALMLAAAEEADRLATEPLEAEEGAK